jgi:hypothetical protein
MKEMGSRFREALVNPGIYEEKSEKRRRSRN